MGFISDTVNLFRVLRASLVMIGHDGLSLLEAAPDDADMPSWLKKYLKKRKKKRDKKLKKTIAKSQKNEEKDSKIVQSIQRPSLDEKKLSKAMLKLGPTYIKLGQFLATRPDIVGVEIASNLSLLQDKLPSFSQSEARKAINEGLGQNVDDIFIELSKPIAAASIAQVHKGKMKTASNCGDEVAVKILRPDIASKFKRDLKSFNTAARYLERFHEPSRRLRPISVVETLEESVRMELDMRFEAAAISEMAENIKDDLGFRVPQIDWELTSQRVLTTEWINGIPISEVDKIKEAGHNMEKISDNLIQSFLRHAIRDGFFHADMHQGNLFVDNKGDIVAVDFGIMGRLGEMERRFLAEILYCFITRDYKRNAEVHFEAGYVSNEQSLENFAQALRAIGEPLQNKTAKDISMARLLGQLFLITEQFNMRTQPQLILLQKTMMVVEGVARTFNNELNIWEVARPVVEEWLGAKLGPEGKISDAALGAADFAKFVAGLPVYLSRMERNITKIAENSQGLNLGSSATYEKPKSNLGLKLLFPLWSGGISLLLLALDTIGII